MTGVRDAKGAPSQLTEEAPAGRATRLLFQSTFVFWGHFVSRAAELGLTPAQAHALMVLEPDHALTMRELADALECDPSTVTGLADRLETHGLIGRQALAGDRRVKALALTDAGILRRAQLLELLSMPPVSVRAMGPQVLGQLADALERILAEEAAGSLAASAADASGGRPR